MVAPLNWGLGHATRCIPIIKELIELGYEPVVASDGPALALLKKELPDLIHIELPSYNITYSKNAKALKWKLLLNSPKINRVIREENKMTQKLVEKFQLHGIISDNRWGVRSPLINKNVFITHQLHVPSGNTTFFSSYIQQKYISKFNECWVPDSASEKNLSGKLGHPKKLPENVKYIGNLSRLQKTDSEILYKYLVILSGPEPQRSILEDVLLKEFKNTKSEILFIRGVISEETFESPQNIKVKNYLFGNDLENAINSSEIIISRSGYTTLMDLSKLKKKAFFIPTPGQPEQEYLAERMKKLNAAPYCKQEKFKLDQLKKVENYKGLGDLGQHTFLGDCFALFEGE